MNTEYLKEERLKLLQCQKEKRHFNFLFNKAVKENNRLKQTLAKLNQTVVELQEKCQDLTMKINNQNACKKGNRKRKSWSQIKCEHTKRKRIEQYGEKILNNIKRNVEECEGADLSLSVGRRLIKYKWRSKDFEEQLQDTTKVQHLHDHNYATTNKTKYEIEREDTDHADYSEFVDSEGNWRKRHIRSIINVMDKFRISHEAYHELKMVSKSQLPPIGKIAREKKIMSEELPYLKHPTVNTRDFRY